MERSTAHTNKLKLIWGIILIVGPGALIVLAILGYAILNFIVGATVSGDGTSLFAGGGAFKTIVNIILYLIGALSILTFIPGLVVGIILLATRK